MDVSYAQGAGLPTGPKDFVIIRLGYSKTLDVDAKAHIEECKKRNIPFALYWFLYNTYSGREQADAAVKAMNDLGVWGHKLIIDAEGTVNTSVVRSAIRRAKALLKPSDKKFQYRRRVGIYSGEWARAHGGYTFGAQFGWLAAYVPEPTLSQYIPRWWKGNYRHRKDRPFLVMWQYTDAPQDRDFWLADPTHLPGFFRPIDRTGKPV